MLEECSDKTRKDIPHIIYGLCNKSRNRKQITACFLDDAEARAYGGYLKKLGPGYIGVKQRVKDLSEGYLPVGRLELNAMRRRLQLTLMGLVREEMLWQSNVTQYLFAPRMARGQLKLFCLGDLNLLQGFPAANLNPAMFENKAR